MRHNISSIKLNINGLRIQMVDGCPKKLVFKNRSILIFSLNVYEENVLKSKNVVY